MLSPLCIHIYLHILRTKANPLQRTVHSFQCKTKRCRTCGNVKETKTFTSTITDETFKKKQT